MYFGLIASRVLACSGTFLIRVRTDFNAAIRLTQVAWLLVLAGFIRFTITHGVLLHRNSYTYTTPWPGKWFTQVKRKPAEAGICYFG